MYNFSKYRAIMQNILHLVVDLEKFDVAVFLQSDEKRPLAEGRFSEWGRGVTAPDRIFKS